MQPQIIRVVDGGGSGYRRDDIVDGKPSGDLITRGPASSKEEIVDFALENLQPGTIGIAYAIAGVIQNRNLFLHAPNAPVLKGVALAGETMQALPQGSTVERVAVFNDMEAVATGIATLLPRLKTFLAITWSTGIGIRIWHNGALLTSLSEGGHLTIWPTKDAKVCGCGKRGHAEAYCGGVAIEREALQFTVDYGIQLEPDVHPMEVLNQHYAAGDARARDIYQSAAEAMGMLLGNIISLVPLGAIVWRGTIAEKMLGALESTIRDAMQQQIIEPDWVSAENLQFIMSPEPKRDQLIGAAACLEQLR